MRNKEDVGSSSPGTSLELTEETMQRFASEGSLHRGLDYCEQGAVLAVGRRGNQLIAEVQGSQYEPYFVQISLDTGDLAGAACNCPYDWEGICKHIVATLLVYINEPDLIEERPAIETLLAVLDRERLQTILLNL